MRKRRSSRSGTLSSSSSTFPNSLLFRSVPEEHFNIYDWQVTIQPRISPNPSIIDFDNSVGREAEKTFNSFINPFAKSSRAAERPHISAPIRPELYRNSHSMDPYSSGGPFGRDRPNTSTLISPSPSLRSRRSDLSSQASLQKPMSHKSQLPIQHMPPDLPSPVSTLNHDDQLISGWTSAQGRSSALSSHTRASASISTELGATPPSIPRETILDRAFKQRCIPGSDRKQKSGGDENMSSIARFEALMREQEAKRRPPLTRPGTGPEWRSTMTGWELEEESEGSSVGVPSEDEALPRHRKERDVYTRSNSDEDPEKLSLTMHTMPTPAQKALEYISGRTTPNLPPHRPSSSKSVRHQMTEYSQAPTPPMPTSRTRPMSLSLAPGTSLPQGGNHGADDSTGREIRANRRSSTSAKRLSFTEFAKRLSSTSSLLIVQTNQSSASGSHASSRHSRASNISSDASFGFNDASLDAEPTIQKGLSQSRPAAQRHRTISASDRHLPLPLQRAVSDDSHRGRNGCHGAGLSVLGGEGGFM
jgi:hypothetical protein